MMEPIVYKGQRVITTELMASVYETEPGNIRNNYSNHKGYFTESVHFFLLLGEELRAFKRDTNNIGVVAPNVNQLYLWTERGANRHCKILDTDKAWEQFDHLEETYFRVKSMAQGLPSGNIPPAVSPNGIARLLSISRRIMLDMGCTASEVGQMMQTVYHTWNVPLPGCMKQIPGQLSFWEQKKLAT